MSIAVACEDVSNINSDTVSVQPNLLETRNRTAERTRLRLPNKTQWSLADILRYAKEGRVDMEEMLVWIKRETMDAKGKFDSARLERLGELSALVAKAVLRMAKLERLASDARLGEYDGGQQPTPGGQP